MKQNSIIFLLIFGLFSCNTEGVKKETGKLENKDVKEKVVQGEDPVQALVPTNQVDLFEAENGLKIKWFEHGKGDFLKDGDVVQINYDVRLEDGTLVDGNQLLKRDFLPFLVGFGLQTSGWDIAFRKLKVGDFVEIILPGDLARGKAGIKNLIPPNATNIIHARILKKVNPTRVIDGTKVWLLEENETEEKIANEESTVDFHYMVSSPSHPKYDISYRRAKPFEMRFSDNGIVRGLKLGLLKAKKSDKLWIVIPAAEAYGNKGLVDLVKPGENIFYDIFIMDVR
ncbi:MAG: FKBP-type peptidyl-prolyl cis-trans isomerase [Crocinitomicaceae bacterium]|nr:FKBP-type peptidyl-prolyl cis-trans isomerase [Crocinitomicaceae bacterium]